MENELHVTKLSKPRRRIKKHQRRIKNTRFSITVEQTKLIRLRGENKLNYLQN